ncbi:hypothetical protein BVC80_8649g7 [Macleaya cordata]|uniref:Uncharacterized protein n=1 Tax=Macleaya cordata TaxID=56857 RepID=A0A200QBI3_MACCD|nr:hypothetical protein BVC80_8649g7 [Macleaya cordata]
MAACYFPDIWAWMQNLLPVTQWKTNSMSICIFSSKSTQTSLNLTITKNLQNQNPSLSFSIVADLNIPIPLWISKSFKHNIQTPKFLDNGTLCNLFCNFIKDVLNYGPTKNTSFLYIPSLDTISNFKDVFNLSFFTLTLLICIYEAPQDIRLECLNALKNHLIASHSKETSKTLMRLLGSNIEEQWVRSLNLAITNWIVELDAQNHILRTPSPLFSYSISALGLWKVQLYCPIIAMNTESSSNASADERLQFSLRHHQLEGVIQFGYKVVVQEKWVNVIVKVDNIRCDVIRLVSETLLTEKGAGAAEKHFPSRISLQLTPTLQTNVLSISVSKSSENPAREIGLEKTIEGSFDPPNSFLGFKAAVSETMTMSLKPWKFEQSIYGYSANLNWFLHDSVDGREVFSTKPSKIALLQPKAWFKNRYSSAYRPFTKQGGVIFAGDEYGESVLWKVDRGALGKTMEWEIKGKIWLTYWPNKHRTFYTETRGLEFREILQLSLV